MKKIKLSFAALALLAVFSFSSCNQESKVVEVEEEVVVEQEGVSGTFTVDTEASQVEWLGKKITGEHFGTIAIQDGSFTAENGVLVSGNAVIDMTSITVLDIEDEESNAKLTGHLSSDDFFGVENFPTSTLSFSAEGDAFVGELTIKGITKPVSFNAELTEVEGLVVAVGTITVDRTEYDVKYGSGKFFDNLGDNTISDEFKLSFTIVAQ